jgi:hypothetical protein
LVEAGPTEVGPWPTVSRVVEQDATPVNGGFEDIGLHRRLRVRIGLADPEARRQTSVDGLIENGPRRGNGHGHGTGQGREE